MLHTLRPHIIAFAGSFVLTSCWTLNSPEYPFLEQLPPESELVGTYTLLPHSQQRLTEMGFPTKNGTIQLDANGTFHAVVPHVWWGPELTDYDTCSGDWVLEQPVWKSKNYHVILHIDSVSPGSVYWSCKDHPSPKPKGSVSLGIADRTEERDEYALALPLNNGDHGYLIFLKTPSR